eukprot:768582-Hanusia_phi.AAC.6
MNIEDWKLEWIQQFDNMVSKGMGCNGKIFPAASAAAFVVDGDDEVCGNIDDFNLWAHQPEVAEVVLLVFQVKGSCLPRSSPSCNPRRPNTARCLTQVCRQSFNMLLRVITESSKNLIMKSYDKVSKMKDEDSLSKEFAKVKRRGTCNLLCLSDVAPRQGVFPLFKSISERLSKLSRKRKVKDGERAGARFPW